MQRTLREISDRIFDRLASRNGKTAAILALAVPALAAGLVITVHPGDTLSAIAQAKCGNSGDWSGIYQANAGTIGANPNLIEPGQKLVIKCSDPGWSAPVASNVGSPAGTSNSSAPSVGTSTVSTEGDSSFQQCVISRESGGQPQIWNASGHYGLYQFSEGTWVAYGGSAADFGNASAAEQTQVFDNAMATAGGAGNWAPYDGC